MTGGRVKNVLLVGLAVVMVNLPFVHSSWQDHRISSDGVVLSGEVTDQDVKDDEHYLTFQVAAGVDQPAFGGTVRVDEATAQTAEDSGQVEVRALPGSTTVWNVVGEERSRLGLAVTLMADLFLLVMVLLLARFGSRLRSDLVLVATENLVRCPPGASLDPIDGQRYVVQGEVEEILEDGVVLDLGDRRVRVILDGHHNPAGYQQPVRATGTMRG